MILTILIFDYGDQQMVIQELNLVLLLTVVKVDILCTMTLMRDCTLEVVWRLTLKLISVLE